MKTCILSHIGNSRNNQEDNVLIDQAYLDLNAIKTFLPNSAGYCEEIDLGKNHSTLQAVSDGMGGASSGEIASYMSVRYLSEHYFDMIDGDRTKLQEIIADLNRKIWREAQTVSEYRGMGATLCGFVMQGKTVRGFHVGDSRLYKFANGELIQLTKDHSEGRRLVDLGLLTEEEVKSFPNRKAIYRYIGMKTDLAADVFDIEECKKGTILLLCTDGLTDVLTNLEVQEILKKNVALKEKGKTLMNEALKRNMGYGDNITIILTEFQKG